jgi:hypothetical protein
MRGRTFRVKVLVFGWIWTLGSAMVAESTMGAAKPQEPEGQSGAQSAQNQKEREDAEKNKKETPKDPDKSDQESTSGSAALCGR